MRPENTLELFSLGLNGYGVNDSDLSLSISKYKRFQMKDIFKILKQDLTISETTPLTLLEQSTDAKINFRLKWCIKK